MSILSNDFVISIKNGRANRRFSEIECAFRKEKSMFIKTEQGTYLPASRFDTQNGVPFVEFMGMTRDNNCDWALVCRIKKGDNGECVVTFNSSIISPVKIELENVEGKPNLYKPNINNIAIWVQEMRDYNATVEVYADGQVYPYIDGNQIEVTFGKMDTLNREFVFFRASSGDTFVRNTFPVGK